MSVFLPVISALGGVLPIATFFAWPFLYTYTAPPGKFEHNIRFTRPEDFTSFMTSMQTAGAPAALGNALNGVYKAAFEAACQGLDENTAANNMNAVAQTICKAGNVVPTPGSCASTLFKPDDLKKIYNDMKQTPFATAMCALKNRNKLLLGATTNVSTAVTVGVEGQPAITTNVPPTTVQIGGFGDLQIEFQNGGAVSEQQKQMRDRFVGCLKRAFEARDEAGAKAGLIEAARYYPAATLSDKDFDAIWKLVEGYLKVKAAGNSLLSKAKDVGAKVADAAAKAI